MTLVEIKRLPLRPLAAFRVTSDATTRIWRCSSCGKEGKWTKGWRWYGSISDLEGHHIAAKRKAVQGIRAIICAACAVAFGIPDKDGWDDDDDE